MSQESEPRPGEISIFRQSMTRRFLIKAGIGSILSLCGVSAFAWGTVNYYKNVRPVEEKVREEVEKEAALLNPDELPCLERADPKTEILRRRGGLPRSFAQAVSALGAVMFVVSPLVLMRGLRDGKGGGEGPHGRIGMDK